MKHFKKLFLPCLLLFFVVAGTLSLKAQSSSSGNSPGGQITLTKSANVSSVAVGGGSVTYTFKVKNNTNNNLYFKSISDDKLGSLGNASGLTGYWGTTLSAGATATWTVTKTITSTTTNTATATFGTSGWGGTNYSASATITVTVASSTSNDLWYSSDECSNSNGSLGIVATNTGIGTSKYTINNGVGSAAVAVDPTHPNHIYYIPRTTGFGGSYEGMYRYDNVNNTNTLVSNANKAPDVVRLAVAPPSITSGNVVVYTITGDGNLQWLNINTASTTTDWSSKSISLPSGYSWSNLGSGDMVFDGNGTLYFIASNSNPTAYLFSISSTELAKSNPTASLVGSMGSGQFNGIAFTEDGNLWATASISGCSNGFYKVNILNGSTTFVGSVGHNATDLGSGALPMATLQVKKTADKTTAAQNDIITYTIKVCNVGNLPATAVKLSDAIPIGTSYVAGSTKLNGTAVPDNSGMPFVNSKAINSAGAIDGVVAGGACATLTFQVKVTISSGKVCNQATVTSSAEGTILSDDPGTAPGNDATCVPVQTVYKIEGNVFHDTNGLLDNTVNGTGTNVLVNGNGTVYAVLKTAAGDVVDIVPVQSDGTYKFENIPAGDYKVMITSDDQNTATPVPPPGWGFTGEHLGTGAGNDAPVDGILSLGTISSNVTNANFGIQKAPDSTPKTYAISSKPQSGATISLSGTSGNAPLMSGSDPEDGTYTGNTGDTRAPKGVKITSLPTHGELWYNGVKVLPSDITNGTLFPDPSKFSVVLTGQGYSSTSFEYAYIDATGVADPSPATYTLSWDGPLPVLFGAINAYISGSKLVVNFTSEQETNNDHFEIEASTDGKTFTKIGEVVSQASGGNSSTPLHYEFTTSTSGAAFASGIGLLLMGFAFKRRHRLMVWTLATVCFGVMFITGCKKDDSVAVNGNSKLFIRIVQIDKDGNKSYSEVVSAYVK